MFLNRNLMTFFWGATFHFPEVLRPLEELGHLPNQSKKEKYVQRWYSEFKHGALIKPLGRIRM